MHSRNILPGFSLLACLSVAAYEPTTSVDPPELNPRPTQGVTLYLSAPESLKVRVGANYSVGHWLGVFGGGGEYCGPDVNAPRDAPMSQPVPRVIVPIDFKKSGAHGLEGKFFIDHFRPGRCHWTFSSLDTLSPVQDFVSSFSRERTNYNFDTTSYGNTYNQSPVQEADLWCGLDPSPRESEKGKMLCTSLEYFVLYPGTVANELVANIPVSQIFNSRVNLFPFTATVTLRYHDLVAENRAAIATVSTHSNKRLPCPIDGVRIYVDNKGQIIVNGTNVASSELFMHLRALTPAPKRACYALAAALATPSVSAMTVLTDIGIFKLPLSLYADDSFTTLVQLK
jgi:hypothetical protein